MPQLPDGKLGHYYVTARDRGKTAFLLGPFTQTQPGTLAHRRALGLVRYGRRRVMVAGYSDTSFASFGTSRLPLDVEPPRAVFGKDEREWLGGS